MSKYELKGHLFSSEGDVRPCMSTIKKQELDKFLKTVKPISIPHPKKEIAPQGNIKDSEGGLSEDEIRIIENDKRFQVKQQQLTRENLARLIRNCREMLGDKLKDVLDIGYELRVAPNSEGKMTEVVSIIFPDYLTVEEKEARHQAVNLLLDFSTILEVKYNLKYVESILNVFNWVETWKKEYKPETTIIPTPLFTNAKPAAIATNLMIRDGVDIITRRKKDNTLHWDEDENGKLCYRREAMKGKASLFYFLREPSKSDPEAGGLLAREAAFAVLEAFDPRAACFHILYAGCAAKLKKPWEETFTLTSKQIFEHLGLNKQTNKTREEKLRLIEELSRQPAQIMTYAVWPRQDKKEGFTFTEPKPFWDIIIHYHTDKSKKKVESLTIEGRAGLWAKYFLNQDDGYRHIGYISQKVLQDFMACWHNNPGAANLMLWLVFQSAIDKGKRLAVSTLMDIAYGKTAVAGAYNDRLKRQRIADRWDDDLRILNDNGWKIIFDKETYPVDIQPCWNESQAKKFNEPDSPENRPTRYFNRLLSAHVTIYPPTEINHLLPEKKPKQKRKIKGSISERLKKTRQAINATQAQVAEQTGITQAAISMIEKRKRKPDDEARKKLEDWIAQNSLDTSSK